MHRKICDTKNTCLMLIITDTRKELGEGQFGPSPNLLKQAEEQVKLYWH